MTKRPNENNERIKRDYMHYRKHARQCSQKTMDREIAYLERFDIWNGRKDFAKFHLDWAMGFRSHLDHAKTDRGKPLAKSTSRAIMATLRDFFIWLSQRDGFRSRIRLQDADYFRLSRRDEAEARAAPEREAPSINQAKRALSMMPDDTPRELRDKALFALLCLTGTRAGAAITLRIKHIDFEDKSVRQNPREVATKFGKNIESFFHKGFPEAEEILARWITYLDEIALYGPDDPLFPASERAMQGFAGVKSDEFERRHWSTTEPVRRIVNGAFHRAGLQAFGPHAFRHMHARRAARECKSVPELIAVADNLGHTDVLTTLRSYGQISREDQRRLITGEERGQNDA